MPYVLDPGVKAFDYQITDIGSELTLATFCHENGHMICDYPDLYDYGYESRGAGVYCLMCSGGSDEKNPTQICAYLKYKSGWAKKLTTISGKMQGQISAEENDFFIYRKNLAEYFVIENRYRSGRDQRLPSSGLAIWHVDELGSNNNEDMTPTRHYECSLEQADNQFDLEKGQKHGDVNDLFSTTTGSKFSNSTTPDSKWWDGTDSGLVLSNIGESGTVMNFDIGCFEEEDAQTFHQSSVPQLDIPDSDSEGVRDIIHFSEDGAITTVKVTVDITHTYIGDLTVGLESPSGILVNLHRRAGARADNLIKTYNLVSTPELKNLQAETIKGKWQLKVADLAGQDLGKLNHWRLSITRQS
jgi:subtilisin-like proprotein convertase family protein